MRLTERESSKEGEFAPEEVREHALNANVALGIKEKRRQVFPFPKGQGSEIIDTRRNRRGVAQEKDADGLQNACFPTIVSAACEKRGARTRWTRLASAPIPPRLLALGFPRAPMLYNSYTLDGVEL